MTPGYVSGYDSNHWHISHISGHILHSSHSSHVANHGSSYTSGYVTHIIGHYILSNISCHTSSHTPVYACVNPREKAKHRTSRGILNITFILYPHKQIRSFESDV
ncbi:hypothetical protein MSBRM_1452 [Methanosarcina barkeri MS]|uniref:Uncharacterized protein n=1 Tax=Methanosarcina barkeri MS TaxID=1434108 RepID=A0A0E3QUM3_METBA|nr:hypothetical protein MSBRM_1452 [Methanosarcina barkeri MS]